MTLLFHRDALDTTINYGAHSKFVEKWLDILQSEDEAASKVAEEAPTETATAEEPSAQ